MFAAVLVVADFLFGHAAAIAGLVLLFVLVVVTWYVLPIVRGRDPRVRRTE